MAKCIMIQGTSSNSGKSVMVAALCRIFADRGYKVAPFKSQNMSLNSYTTQEGGEIAIAQVLQAEAARIEPHVDMNPILLKPKGNFISQVIVQGKSIGDMNFYDYQNKFRDTALNAINESLNQLKKDYDIIIIEGAGSPAEINMRKEDMANMEIAHLADADVLLVADIDKGGVFASIAGTFILLDDYDRERLKAVIINKFRGSLDILQPGIDKIEEIVNTTVLGVIPYDESLKLPEEDSASLEDHKFNSDREITIGVLKLPKISNFTDIDPFEFEEDVGLNMINIYNKSAKEELSTVDGIIIPGTRNTIEDMVELEKTGIARKLRELSTDIPIIGICGGYQILGEKILDEYKKESDYGTINGLGLLKVETKFDKENKIVEQSIATLKDSTTSNIFKNIINETVKGYEIHEGRTISTGSEALFEIKKGCGNKEELGLDGAIEGHIIGTYFHGIFHNYNFRNEFINYLRVKKGLEPKYGEDPYESKKNYSLEQLAKIVEENIDMSFIDKLLEDNS
ncbi:MAG: cobyric acid synthase CobQ [Methanobacteriaceae archaeon]